MLLYTSGTSGLPRGAMLSHRALLANIDQVASVDPPMLTSTDVVLGVLPLFHVYGLNAVLGGILHRRAKLVLAETFSPEGTLDLVDDEAISVVPVAPPVFAHWLPMDDLALRLGPVRLVLSGSAPLAADVVDRFVEITGVPVHQGYGLTEAAPVVTSTLCSSDAESGSVGSAIPGIEMRLIDEDGLPPEGSDPGEIEIRGDNLFSGYWPDGADGPDDEGWWRTGDVGFLDDDGDLFLIDRVKELVIVSGFNVYPIEVEEVLRHVDGVREAAVIGAPHDETGETVVAYVVIDGDEERVLAAIDDFCAANLARFKQPTEVHVLPALPHTATGKVQRGACAPYDAAARPCSKQSVRDRPRHPLHPQRLPPLRGGQGRDRGRLRRAGESFEEIDVDDAVGLPARYDDEVPVTLVDGKQHDFWRVDPDRLRAALRD
ncbi:AMP-binding protein [Nocardioides alcanivorans]|uniref:AMP-binding protein n=1 Tax=Nocardioides alcanivorans TaxID=2897352 RepID=UPI0028A24893|nr:AMP-binding protein [Nocardioides alcanivorans]